MRADGVTSRVFARHRAEIEAIIPDVAPALAGALHALRRLGNIGAHPHADPNIIVDVEPGEATAMLGLLELLIEETSVVRHEREERIAHATAIAETKGRASSASAPEPSDIGFPSAD